MYRRRQRVNALSPEISCAYLTISFLCLIAIESAAGADDTLERLRNITKMFAKSTDDDERQNLKKVEKVAPSDKMKNTFQK